MHPLADETSSSGDLSLAPALSTQENEQPSSLTSPLNTHQYQRLPHSQQLLFESNIISPSSEKSIPLLLNEDTSYYSNNENIRIYREVILVTISVFMGYASLVVVQKKLYNQYKENNSGSLTDSQTSLFEHGTSLVYVGNLIFRLLHNIVFACITPRWRVVIALFCISFSMFLLSFVYFLLHSSSVAWLYISYIIGGIAVGTFEANLLSTITPLGHDTKLWAIIGMPAGFTLISVIGYLLMGIFDMSVVVIYLVTGVCALLSVVLWLFYIPIPVDYNQLQTLRSFTLQLQEWRLWFSKIFVYCVSLMFDMFFVSFWVAINQYVLDGDDLPIFGESDKSWGTMNTNDFFSIYSFGTFIGDTLGRKIIYHTHAAYHPSFYLIFSFIGAFLCTLKIPLLSFFGIFLIFLANGLIYASSTMKIDVSVNSMYSLTALSIWLFVGDIGSVTGSNIWQFFVPVVCAGTSGSGYFCVKDSSAPTGMPTMSPMVVHGFM